MKINDVSSRKLKGVVPVLLAPLMEDRRPDFEGTQRLVDMLVNSGVGGFWALGSASEDINLSLSSKIAVARAASIANNKRVPLIMGVGLTSMDDIFSYYDEVSDFDLDGIHLLPYDTKMGEDRMIHFFTTMAEKSPFPLWLYHNPKRGRVITDKVISEVKGHPNISGIKVGGYNLSELTSAIMHRSDSFDVIGAGSGQLFTMLSLGAQAHTTSDASAIPEPFVELYKLYCSGEIEQARELQFKIINLTRQFPRTDNGEHAAEEKYILKLRDICDEYLNPLYRTLSANEKDKLQDILKEYGFPWA
jgi:dihydrodipicolinate synthase/N-acetylneuraminate lyase